MRQEFSAKVKVAAWQRSKGKCECCDRKLYPGDIHYDHDNPDGLTGTPSLDNCRVLCRSCHSVKTKKDVADIAKAKRRERRHVAAERPKTRPLPGTKASGVRKRMDGTVERR